jgi:hypothetical protein
MPARLIGWSQRLCRATSVKANAARTMIYFMVLLLVDLAAAEMDDHHRGGADHDREG